MWINAYTMTKFVVMPKIFRLYYRKDDFIFTFSNYLISFYFLFQLCLLVFSSSLISANPYSESTCSKFSEFKVDHEPVFWVADGCCAKAIKTFDFTLPNLPSFSWHLLFADFKFFYKIVDYQFFKSDWWLSVNYLNHGQN